MKYGQGPYGDGVKYGDTSPVPVYPGNRWAVQVDWDGDGAYDPGVNEGDHLRYIRTTRGRQYYINTNGENFEPMQDGEASLILDNEDGRYDQFNALSPLYPNVEAGKYIRVWLRKPGEKTYQAQFTGTINDLNPQERNGEQIIELTCVDGWRFLRDQKVEIALTTNAAAKIGSWIRDVLIAAGWPAIWGTSITDNPTIWDVGNACTYFWSADVSAAEAINELTNADLGVFYLKADGQPVFVDKDDVPTSEGTIEQADILRNVKLPQPYEVVRNIVQVEITPLSLGSSGQLYAQSGTAIPIGVGQTIVIVTDLSSGGKSVPCQAGYTVTVTAWTNANGSGTNISASITKTSVRRGESIEHHLTNTHATLAGYITAVTVTGIPLNTGNKYRVESVIADPKPRTFLLSSKWINDYATAQNIAGILKYRLARTDYPTIQMENQAVQFDLELFEMYTLDIPAKSIQNAYLVASIEHEALDDTCNAVRTTARFEPPLGNNFWVFPVQIGVDSIVGY